MYFLPTSYGAAVGTGLNAIVLLSTKLTEFKKVSTFSQKLRLNQNAPDGLCHSKSLYIFFRLACPQTQGQSPKKREQRLPEFLASASVPDCHFFLNIKERQNAVALL